MGNEKNSFLKQWFTFTFGKDKRTTLVYSCTNNHYIHTWLEKKGYTEFRNIISQDDLDDFIIALNDSSNMIPNSMNDFFPDSYIENYSMWNMDNGTHWSFIEDYREHAKEQMSKLFDGLWDIQDMLEDGVEGVLEYNIFYYC